MDYPYGTAAASLENGDVLVAFEHWHNPVALPINSEINTVILKPNGEITAGPFSLTEPGNYYYNPHFIKIKNKWAIFYNEYNVKKNGSGFGFRFIDNIAKKIFINSPDDLSGQMRPWFFPSINSQGAIAISYEFKNLNEHPDAELKRNHLKISISDKPSDFNKSQDLGIGVMPRNESFSDGTRIFTRQNGIVDGMKVFFRLSKDEKHWSAETPISSHSNVHDAIPFKRLDGRIDLYYIASDGDEKFVVYRRYVDSTGRMGEEVSLTNVEQGSFVQPRPIRLKDGRILLLITKDAKSQQNYEVWATYLDGDTLGQANPPGVCFNLIQKRGYEAAFKCQIDNEPQYIGTPEEPIFRQYTATILSFLGSDLEAKQKYDSSNSLGRQVEFIESNNLKKTSALGSIVDAAKDRRIVMINEAHHLPQTRFLSIELLQPLYDLGFRYFAAETFNEAFLSQTEKDGIPRRNMGFYSAEPTFSLLVRKAKEIGFKLIPYESSPTCDPFNEPPERCQNLREEGQAQNLYKRIFIKDPDAKVLIHAGYGHIDKVGGGSDFNWIPMARYLKEITKLDPLSIDQVTFMERGNLQSENPNYRRLVKTFSIEEPSILEPLKGRFWVSPKYKNHYDVQVISPPEKYKASRPTWRSEIDGINQVHIKNPCRREQKCLAQAFLKNEAQGQNFIPFDQVITTSSKDVLLLLKKGEFLVKFIDLASLKSVSEVKHTVH